jgi:hypothetical protein
MQHTDHARCRRPVDHVPRVVFGVAGVNDERTFCFRGQRDLGVESIALHVARGIVVMVVEAALSNRYRAGLEAIPEQRDVAPRVERRRVMGVNSGGGENESRIVGGQLRGDSRRRQRLTDADYAPRARRARARDYRVAVAGERRVREVGVAVDEVWRVLVWRGHLRSIQSSTGAAT